MANPNPTPPPVEHRFKAGQSANPGGKPKAARNRLQTKFLYDLAEDFEQHGKKAIQDARESDPMRYIQVVAALMPKQVEETKPMDDITDAELIAGIAVLRGQLSSSAGEGTSAPGITPQVN